MQVDVRRMRKQVFLSGGWPDAHIRVPAAELRELLRVYEAWQGAQVVHDVTGKYGFVGRKVRLVPAAEEVRNG